MKSLAFVAMALGVLWGAGPVYAQGAQKPDPAVVKIRDAYLAATKARDAAKLAELYTEDAVEMPPYQKPVKGRAAIRSHYEMLFKGGPVELSGLQLQSIDTRTAGDLAYDVGTYRQTVAPKGGKPQEDSGNFVVLLRRMPDGQWRVTHAIYNSHHPPAGASGMQ